MFPFLPLGPLAIPTEPFIVILGVFGALLLLEHTAVALQFDREKFSQLGTITLLAGFVGARFTHVFFYWADYATNPLGILWPLTSGYSAFGAILGGVAAIFFYSRARKWSYTAVADVLAPSVLVGLAALSLADWLGGSGYGVPLSETMRHPVQLYEVLAAGLGLFLWWWARPTRPFAGSLALLATAGYAAGMLFALPFRANPWLVGQGWLGGQLVYAALLWLALGGMVWGVGGEKWKVKSEK